MDANRANQITRIINIIANALTKLRMVCRSSCCDSECRINNNNMDMYIDENTKRTKGDE